MLKEDRLVSWYRRQEQPCWRLLDGDCTRGGDDKRNVIATYMPESNNVDYDEGENLLTDTLDELQPGVYTLETYTAPTASKTKRAVAFRHTTEEEESIGRASRSSSSFDDFIGKLKEERESALEQARSEFQRELKVHDLEMENKQLQKELNELKSENKELEERASEIENKKVSYIGQAVSAFTGMFAPQPQPAIGIVDGGGKGEQKSDEERLQNVVMILRQKEPEMWLDLLEGIARVAQYNPETYNMARNFLIQK